MNMKFFIGLTCAGFMAIAGNQARAAAVPSDDVLSRMFIWWDKAFKEPGAYTQDAFRKYMTENATLTLEGRTVIHNVREWSEHFQKIQSGGGEVEIVVPFKDVFERDGQIYTYHVIRARRNGHVTCELAAGHATIQDGKISSITLVRAPSDAAHNNLDAQCWTK